MRQLGTLGLAAVLSLSISGAACAQATPASSSTPSAPQNPAAVPGPGVSPGNLPSQSGGGTPPLASPQSSAPASDPAGTATPLPTLAPAGDTQAASKPDGKKSKKDKNVAKADVNALPASDSLPSPGEDLNPHIKKGSEEDVNAIGTRNIGGRGLGNWYSTNWELGVGKQYSMEVEKSAHLITDPVVVEYVNRIGQNLVKNSDAKVPFTIKVIDSDEINAMALPGGFFYVNSGLIMAADEEAELAGVMAHEISHVVAHHAARQQTKLNMAQIGSIPLMIMTEGTWTGYGIYEATQLAIPMTFLKFSRMDEAEADYLGVQYMYKAGYDPQAFITMFEKIDAIEKHKPGILSKAFSDHPQTPSRIAATEDEIATILPAKNEYIVTTSEFDDKRHGWHVSRTNARSTVKRTATGRRCGGRARAVPRRMIPTTQTAAPIVPL